jgi:hypothetical protein
MEIPISQLVIGEQLYRKIDQTRVDNLSDEFLLKHSSFYQPLCVMLEGFSRQSFVEDDGKNKVTWFKKHTKYSFESSIWIQISSYKFKVLGGQHNVAACKNIVKSFDRQPETRKMISEESFKAIQFRYCMVYGQVSTGIQLFLSKEHQRLQDNAAELVFQDQVKPAQFRGLDLTRSIL